MQYWMTKCLGALLGKQEKTSHPEPDNLVTHTTWIDNETMVRSVALQNANY